MTLWQDFAYPFSFERCWPSVCSREGHGEENYLIVDAKKTPGDGRENHGAGSTAVGAYFHTFV